MNAALFRPFKIAAAALCLALACSAIALAAARLDINRLYTLPWVIGVAPQDFVWSGDSQRLAFLWNDEGVPFRDVWLVSRDQPRPVRVTSMPRPPRVAPGNDLATMQQAAAAEIDPGVTQVSWAADSSRLLFVFKGQLYAVRPGAQPELLTGKTSVSQVKPAPTGNNIAFQAGGQLFLVSLGGNGPASTVTQVGSGTLHADNLVWSHDKRSLAFVADDDTEVPRRGIPDYLGAETVLKMVKRPFPGEPSERHRVGIVAAGNEAQVTWAELGGDPLDLVFSIAWSPDNRTLLVDTSDLYIKHRRLMLVDAARASASLLLEEMDPHNVTAEWWADWAPDGRGIYFLSDRENFYQVYFAALTGGVVQRVTPGQGEVLAAEVCARANSLFYMSNEGKAEERHLHQISLRGGPDRQITRAPGTHTTTVSPDGTIAADLFSNDQTPPDLHLQQIAVAQTRQVTHSPLPEFQNYRWVGAQYVTFPSAADGVTLHGRLTLPPNFDPAKKYPAILGSVYSNTVHNQWGGRVAHPTWGLDQYLAQQGYVLLNVDIRGSTGYGKVFRQKLALDYGGIDVEDLYSGVKYLAARGFVDPRRIGIWGSSYGGLLTTMSLFKHPGVYQAGVAGAPATSLFHALTGEMRTMMAPRDHQREYANASSFLHSGTLEDHLMLIHGMQDEIVLFKDSVTLTQRLILAGKDIDLVALPNAPHSWDTGPMAQTRYAYNKLISFFKRYLGEGPQ